MQIELKKESTNKSKIQYKKGPIIGTITILICSPVLIWSVVIISSGKWYNFDALGGILFLFQFNGLVGGILLLAGKISGYYLSISTWLFLLAYGFFKIYTKLQDIPNQSFDFYTWLIIILGIPSLFILTKKIKGIKNECK